MKVKVNVIFIIVILIVNNSLFSQDFRVTSSGTVGFQPHIAADSIGNFVIVWDDYRNLESDVYGQKYDYKGCALGSNFRISDDSSETNISYAGQIFPRISMNKKGDFVVIWQDTRPKGTPSDPTIPLEFNIYGQCYNSDAMPKGSNFLVNDSAAGGQIYPDVIMREDGSFIVIWIDTHDRREGIDRVSHILLQAFDSSGTKIGNNNRLGLYAQQPRIALFKNGNYLITADTLAQNFVFPAIVLGDPFNIPNGFMREIKISYSNKIFIAQAENVQVSDSYSDIDIFLQYFDSLGNMTGRIKINDDDNSSWQLYPALTINESQIFLAWEDYRNGSSAGDSDCEDIYGQRLDLDIKRIGKNFKVSHENDESGQIHPAAVMVNDTIYTAWFDGRSMEYLPVYPPKIKLDIWATILNFDYPDEGHIIRCFQPVKNLPSSFILFQNYPNPTNGFTTFMYDLPEDAEVTLKLYDILGKEVKTIVRGFQTAYRYFLGYPNNELASGVYFARLTAETISGNTLSSMIKLVVIK